jgi:hypothetical protein
MTTTLPGPRRKGDGERGLRSTCRGGEEDALESVTLSVIVFSDARVVLTDETVSQNDEVRSFVWFYLETEYRAITSEKPEAEP